MNLKAKKPVKIIHLSGFNPNKKKIHPSKDSDYYYVASWAGLTARRLASRYPDLDIEAWRAEPEFNNIKQRNIFGLKAIIFPYKTPFIKRTLTYKMLFMLLNYQRKYNLILHYHDLHSYFNYIIPFILKNTKIIISHRGGVPPKRNSLKNMIKIVIENQSFQKIYSITYKQKRTKLYLKNIKNHPNLYFLTTGADFDQFKPMDKKIMRAKLGLKSKKIYAIYVGRFYKLKSVDLMLDMYFTLSKKYNFSIIFVGGEDDKENDLYEKVSNSGCPYFGMQPWEKLNIFYNAADFYIHPAFHPSFGGLDVSWMEALACNIPVLSSQLKELDFDYSKLGISLNNKNELIEKTELMINSFYKFRNCRNIAKRYLDGKVAVIDKLLKIYGI